MKKSRHNGLSYSVNLEILGTMIGEERIDSRWLVPVHFKKIFSRRVNMALKHCSQRAFDAFRPCGGPGSGVILASTSSQYFISSKFRIVYLPVLLAFSASSAYSVKSKGTPPQNPL